MYLSYPTGIGLALINLPSIWFLEKSFRVSFRSIMPFVLLGAFASIAIILNVAAYAEEEYATGATLLLFGVTGWNLIPCGLLFPTSFSFPICDHQQRNMRADGSQWVQENRDQSELKAEADGNENLFSKYMTSLKTCLSY